MTDDSPSKVQINGWIANFALIVNGQIDRGTVSPPADALSACIAGSGVSWVLSQIPDTGGWHATSMRDISAELDEVLERNANLYQSSMLSTRNGLCIVVALLMNELQGKFSTPE